MKNISNLDTGLSKVLDDYAAEIRSLVETSSSDPNTKRDIEELGKQTFYALGVFKDCIVKYLKNV